MSTEQSTTAKASRPENEPGAPPAGPEGTWRPRLGTPRRVLEPAFSGTGLTVATWFFALSLIPSLLPRAGWLQGLVSGITVLIGYGLGAAGQWLWSYLGIPTASGRLRTVLVTVFVGLGLWAAVFTGWRQVGWQNEVRELYGMEPLTPLVWPTILGVTLLVAILFLALARSIRLLFRVVLGRLARRMPRRLSTVLGVGGLLLLFWLLWTGILVNGFFTVANAIFEPRDRTLTEGVEQPTESERSAGPGSLVSWEDLGRQGRAFVSGGPTPEEISAATGDPAVLPIRVYVGLKSAPTAQGRADLVLEELKRTGAFEREALVVATTTGTGWLDPRGVDPFEYVFNGDTAIAGVQYSYLPSWISLLADQDAVKETSLAVFEAVHGYWESLPEQDQPKLYLYGLSLGSYGVESVLSSIDIVNAPVDGALLVGPPFVNDMHATLLANRKADTPPWLPVYRDGRTVRFTSNQDGFSAVEGPWGPTRIVYLQHGSDPIVFFSPNLALEPPEWLEDGQRPPDVSERMDWFPLVTMWQVLLDLPGAGNVPEGFGHLYAPRDNLESWVQIANIRGWSDARTERIAAALEADPAE